VSGAREGNAALAGRVTVQPITDREFHSFQELIHRQVGISLTQAKRDLLVNRLSPRMRELGIASFTAYFRLIEEDEGERVHMLDRISTNETQFFREPRHFEFLEQTVYPDWIARAEAGKMARKIKVWSCACSTGEEPYSLAMSLLSHFGASWSISILATDISTRVLAKAENAMWSLERASHIPAHLLKTYMLRGTRTQEGKMKAGPEIRSLIEFRRFNLNDETYPYRGTFDLIFCRNVLIYFNVAGRQRVIEQLASCLAPGGLLFLGHAETASGATNKLRAVVPTVYRLNS